jgi:hypothetical protein
VSRAGGRRDRALASAARRLARGASGANATNECGGEAAADAHVVDARSCEARAHENLDCVEVLRGEVTWAIQIESEAARSEAQRAQGWETEEGLTFLNS